MTAALAAADPRSRWQRVKGPTLVAGGLMTASLLLHLRDPHRGGSWGFCPWLTLTGTYCPGCGGLRAVNDLTRGDVAAAASSNLLFVASLPLVAFFYLRWFADRWAGVHRPAATRPALLWTVVAVVVAVGFAVLRNLPAGAWLAP